MDYVIRCDELGLLCDWQARGETADAAATDHTAHLQDRHQISGPSQTLHAYLTGHARESGPEGHQVPEAFGSSALGETWPAALYQAARARLRTKGTPNG